MSPRTQSIKLELWIGKVKMNRRSFLQALVAAPAIVSAGNIMRVKPVVMPDVNDYVMTVWQSGTLNVRAERDDLDGCNFISVNGVLVPNPYWVHSAKSGEIGTVRLCNAA